MKKTELINEIQTLKQRVEALEDRAPPPQKVTDPERGTGRTTRKLASLLGYALGKPYPYIVFVSSSVNESRSHLRTFTRLLDALGIDFLTTADGVSLELLCPVKGTPITVEVRFTSRGWPHTRSGLVPPVVFEDHKK